MFVHDGAVAELVEFKLMGLDAVKPYEKFCIETSVSLVAI
jgi:hypothetical protein